jgi:hypothetical protein
MKRGSNGRSGGSAPARPPPFFRHKSYAANFRTTSDVESIVAWS